MGNAHYYATLVIGLALYAIRLAFVWPAIVLDVPRGSRARSAQVPLHLVDILDRLRAGEHPKFALAINMRFTHGPKPRSAKIRQPHQQRAACGPGPHPQATMLPG